VGNLPITAGTFVTISGINFAQADYTASVAYGAYSTALPVATTAWTSSTSVVASNLGGVLPPPMVHGSLIGTASPFFTFDTPVVTQSVSGNANQANSPVTGGASVTIAGLNFVMLNLTPTGQIDRAPCASTSWLAATTMTCLAPAGTGAADPTTVTISLSVATQAQAFTFDAAVVTLSQPFNTPTSDGSSLTLLGTNFFSSETSATAKVGAVTCGCTAWITNTALLCRTSPGVGRVYTQVTVTGLVGTSSQATLTFDAPVVTQHILPNTPPSGGSSLTLVGTNFGYETSTSTIYLNDAISCATTSWQSGTSLQCGTPSSSFTVGTTPLVSVTVAAIVGTSTRRFTYDGPALTLSALANGPVSGGASLTVSGLNFAPSDCTATLSLFTAGLVLTTSWTSATTVYANSPPVSSAIDLSSGHALLLAVNQIAGTGSFRYTFDAPVVSFARESRQNNPASGDDRVTITGLNFFASDYTHTILVSTTRCASTAWTASTAMRCMTAPGSGRSFSYTMNVLSLIGTATAVGALSVTYDTPVVSFTSTRNSAASAGSVLTMGGLNFAVSDTTVSGTLGSTVCASATWTTATTVTCRPTIGGLGAQTLGVVVSAITGTSRRESGFITYFTFDSPAVTRIMAQNGALTGSTPLTVIG